MVKTKLLNLDQVYARVPSCLLMNLTLYSGCVHVGFTDRQWLQLWEAHFVLFFYGPLHFHYSGHDFQPIYISDFVFGFSPPAANKQCYLSVY